MTIQAVSAVFLNGYASGFAGGKLFSGATKAVCVPVLNCYSCPGALGACPIGAMQNAIGAHHKIPFYVLGSIMLFGLFLGRLLCGFLCPFGFLQDLLSKIPARQVKIPDRLDRAGRKVKYLVLLVLVILLPALAKGSYGVVPPYFCKYLCPAGTLEAGIPLFLAEPRLRTMTGVLFDWKILILVLVILGSVIIRRFFCRYLCPLGALYSLFNRFSIYRMEVDPDQCIGCGKCTAVCPMDVEITKDPNHYECIRCGQCKSACPTNAVKSGLMWTIHSSESIQKK